MSGSFRSPPIYFNNLEDNGINKVKNNNKKEECSEGSRNAIGSSLHFSCRL